MKKHLLYLPQFCRWSALLFLLTLLASSAMAQIASNQVASDKLDPEGSATDNALLVCQSGGVQGWGISSQPNPVAVVGPGLFSIVAAVTTRLASNYALRSDGVVLAWGDNRRGALGRGFISSYEATPAPVPGLPGIIAIDAGYGYAMALGSDGSVWHWGLSVTPLGVSGAGNGQSSPTRLTAGFGTSPIVAIQCGTFAALALNQAGQVFAWGWGSGGELGVGLYGTVGLSIPQQLTFPPGSSPIRQIHIATALSLALDTNNKAYGWGFEIGDGTSNSSVVPTAVPALDGATYLGSTAAINALGVSNGATGFAAYDNGTICTTKVWGANSHGGFGTCSPVLKALSPVPGPTFPTGTKIIGSGDMLLSVQPSGTVKTWGNRPLGYTPTSPGIQGGSCVPAAPVGVCQGVANKRPTCTQVFSHRAPVGAGVAYQASLHRAINLPFDIGEFGQLTTIDANRPEYGGNTVVFNGVYHVWGNVRFVGNFRLEPGTVFYVDGENGRVITDGDDSWLTSLGNRNGTLTLDGATIQANCNASLWSGISVLGAGARLVTTGATVRDAQMAVVNSGGSLRLDNTNFFNNLRSVSEWPHIATATEGITNCRFRVSANLGGPFSTPPYIADRYNSYGISFDYNATGPVANDLSAANYSGNTFTELGVGITGLPGNGLLRNNRFVSCWRAAWLYTNSANNPPSALSPFPSRFEDNIIQLPSTFPVAFTTAPNRSVFGLNVLQNVSLKRNTFSLTLAVPGQVVSQRVGAALVYQGAVEDNNQFYNLTVGILATGADWPSPVSYSFRGNDFYGNGEGITFQPAPSNGAYGTLGLTATVRCNSIDNATSASPGTAKGIWVKDKTFFSSDLGSSGTPNGNLFSGSLAGSNRRVVYDATTPFTYHSYDSSQEFSRPSATNPFVPIGNGRSANVTSARGSGSDCAASGNPNGVTANRSIAGLTGAALQSKRDSLTSHAMSAARQRQVLALVLNDYQQRDDLTGLETFWRTVPATRPLVQLGGGLLLLRGYQRAHQPADAQRIRQALQNLTAADPEQLNYLRYWDAVGQQRPNPRQPGSYTLPEEARQLLRLAAASGTAAAAAACEYLQLFDTSWACALPVAPQLLAGLAGNPEATELLGSGFPNPATETVTFPYALPPNAGAAHLVLTDVLGRVVADLALEQVAGQATVPLQALPVGLYLATLRVGGQPLAARKLAVAR